MSLRLLHLFDSDICCQIIAKHNSYHCNNVTLVQSLHSSEKSDYHRANRSLFCSITTFETGVRDNVPSLKMRDIFVLAGLRAKRAGEMGSCTYLIHYIFLPILCLCCHCQAFLCLPLSPIFVASAIFCNIVCT